VEDSGSRGDGQESDTGLRLVFAENTICHSVGILKN